MELLCLCEAPLTQECLDFVLNLLITHLEPVVVLHSFDKLGQSFQFITNTLLGGRGPILGHCYRLVDECWSLNVLKLSFDVHSQFVDSDMSLLP